MGYTEQTQQQIERFLRKVAQKFTAKESDMPMTDIHLRASQDSGDLMAFDDDDNEISRCVISTWIENKSDNFYQEIAYTLRSGLNLLALFLKMMKRIILLSFILLMTT